VTVGADLGSARTRAMPIPYGDDTIDDFVRAANQRYREADVLLANGLNAGSVYLDGQGERILTADSCGG
jgi:hypothetical protein